MFTLKRKNDSSLSTYDYYITQNPSISNRLPETQYPGINQPSFFGRRVVPLDLINADTIIRGQTSDGQKQFNPDNDDMQFSTIREMNFPKGRFGPVGVVYDQTELPQINTIDRNISYPTSGYMTTNSNSNNKLR